MIKIRVDVITMGCSKNLVDSERLMHRLESCGYEVTHDCEMPEGEIAVINTCGFIGDAKEESINMILEFCQRKEQGDLNKLYVMGCLSERYLEELKSEISQVDKFYGKFDWGAIVEELKKNFKDEVEYKRHLTTPSHYAYLKISEGCNRRCAYCAIPIITGSHVSRPIEEIVAEVRYLVDKGVKEFQIIAQELTYYGKDLYKRSAIAELVEKISDVQGVEWIRLHYAYPTNFPDDLLRVMRERNNVCKYLDIALQHVSTKILKKMLRPVTKEETYALVEKLRREVPGICLRTTMMVGFPGETDKDFDELMEFVKWARFDRLGAFAYSEEDGTYAALNYKDRISKKKKQERLDALMTVQQRISTNLNYEKVGRVLKIIIDRIEGDYYVGRTEFDSPEVDTEVLVNIVDGKLNIGSFYNVEITDAAEFDLMGKVV